MNKSFTRDSKEFQAAASMALTAILVFTFSKSPVISIAFSLFIGVFITVAQRKGADKKSLEIQSAAPEMIDHLITGLQSGLSLSESLSGLAVRGPSVLAPYFRDFQEDLHNSGDFYTSLERVKDELAQPSTDLIIEAVLISKTLGGAELMTILRLLGNFIREDLSLRREISVKQNWIKNSAHLSSAAPWLLLLLLAMQPSTVQAFSTITGAGILFIGLFMTVLAYIWMTFLSRLPSVPRVFGGDR